jgi:hypothetical protein
MSAAGITEFLSELSESDSLSTLRMAHIQRSAFVFKVETHLNPVKAYIESFSDKRAILTTEVSDIKLPLETEISMKFNVGTEIFFVKAPLKSYMNRYFFDMGSKVIQLKRRKEPRYLIPPKFSQSATLHSSSGDLPCKIIDISQSGIRLEVLRPGPAYQREDIIKIKFQIHKRAEMQTLAIVRFALNRPGLNQIIGMEFIAEMPEAQRQRVASIVEDIKTVG